MESGFLNAFLFLSKKYLYLSDNSENKYMKNKNWVVKVLSNSMFWFLFLFLVFIGLFCINQENIFNYLDRNNILEKIEKLKPIGLFFAVVIALWQVILANKRTYQNDKNIEISLNNSIDERFKDAIELLGSEKASTRLGAIYALHHLAKETFLKEKSYTKSVFEILCSYIREKTNEEEYIKKYANNKNKDVKPSIEIQTIIDLLFRIKTERKPYLKFNADLNNAKLVGADLENTSLFKANLKNVKLINANLKNAFLKNANLEGANLEGANLISADLENAKLKRAFLFDANLKNANLKNANLKNAKFTNANLENANLENANLENASLFNANLKNTIFKNAKIDGIILTDADLEGSDLKFN